LLPAAPAARRNPGQRPRQSRRQPRPLGAVPAILPLQPVRPARRL